jgi:hypothetical protein
MAATMRRSLARAAAGLVLTIGLARAVDRRSKTYLTPTPAALYGDGGRHTAVQWLCQPHSGVTRPGPRLLWGVELNDDQWVTG